MLVCNVETPTQRHMLAAKPIFKYLKVTADQEMMMHAGKDDQLAESVDAS